MKISDRALDEIREKMNILDIVSEHVTLKNKGEEHTGLCPFHDEKTPSFSVNPNKGVFYCFGCGERGDAITFLLNHTHQSFTEVVTDLAGRYGVELGETEEDAQKWREENLLKKRLCEINETACKFYQSKLNNKSLDYLSSRGINSVSIHEFRLGYAPDEWNDLLNLLLSKYEFNLVLQSGLITQKGDSIYNSFRDRLMMPIFDPYGEVIGFSGRELGGAKPKYLNSPETLLFKKSEVLYPFHLARPAIVQENSALVVEGNFDVIKLHQRGIKNAIASLGTSLSRRQVNKLIRQTKDNNLVLGFDNDEAGDKAVQRVINENIKAIDQNLINLKVMRLPSLFKDVDEVLSVPNQNISVIRDLIDESLPWIEWKIDKILAANNIEDPTDFSNCSKSFSELLGKISDPNLKTFYLEKCGAILARGNKALETEHINALKMTSFRVGNTNNKNKDTLDIFAGLSPRETKTLSCEINLAKISLFFPSYQETISRHLDELRWFTKDPVCRWIFNQIKNNTLDDYLVAKLKTELKKILQTRELFEDTNEFLNSDYVIQNKLMNKKMEQIFSQDEASMLAINQPEIQISDIVFGLKKIKLEERISVLMIFMESEKDKSVQVKYIVEISKLKKILSQPNNALY